MTILPEFAPATSSELARFVAENAQTAKRRLRPVGGRTALYQGGTAAPSGCDISLVGLNRLIDYPARDMTVTVEAGMSVQQLQHLLAQEHQRLPIDIAQGSRATIGGAVATNTSGPRRAGHGTFRDYLIGVSAIDASGRPFKAGGRVVKNVAGYDLCKLLIGSRGSLSILTQMTFKLRPLPEASGFLWATFDTFAEIENVLERLLASDARPVAMDVLNPSAASLVTATAQVDLPMTRPVLCLGVEGSAREVDWQIDKLAREITPYGLQDFLRIPELEANRLWDTLTDFPTTADDPLAFQANLLPSACMEFAEFGTQEGLAMQIHAVNGIAIGQFPEEISSLEQVQALLRQLTEKARAAGGNLTILHCDAQWRSQIPLYGHSEPSMALMRQLKQTMDPENVLNPIEF